MANLRSKTIRLASELPKGDPTRRKLLAAVRESGSLYPHGAFKMQIRVTDPKTRKKTLLPKLYDTDAEASEEVERMRNDPRKYKLPKHDSGRNKGWAAVKIEVVRAR